MSKPEQSVDLPEIDGYELYRGGETDEIDVYVPTGGDALAVYVHDPTSETCRNDPHDGEPCGVVVVQRDGGATPQDGLTVTISGFAFVPGNHYTPKHVSHEYRFAEDYLVESLNTTATAVEDKAEDLSRREYAAILPRSWGTGISRLDAMSNALDHVSEDHLKATESVTWFEYRGSGHVAGVGGFRADVLIERQEMPLDEDERSLLTEIKRRRDEAEVNLSGLLGDAEITTDKTYDEQNR